MNSEFSYIVDLPASAKVDRTMKADASAEQRAAISARIEVLEISEFKASFTAEKIKSGVYQVKGKIKASLTQACVRTLTPVPDIIDESFSVMVMAEDLFNQLDPEDEDGDIEDIELLGDGMVDLGEIAVQYLSLALNPYPTSAGDVEIKGLGENVSILSEEAASTQSSPFAVLKKNPKK